MSRQLDHLTAVILLAFTIVALALGYWTMVRGPEILAGEDNPRLVDRERRIARGAIYDRAGRPLAESVALPDGDYARTYPHPQAAPAVGYYSLRYGVSGVEADYDAALRGEAHYTDWDALLHRTQVGEGVRLTLDLDVQIALAQALDNRAGAVVVIEADTGAVRALVSSPTFDPNTLDDTWDALTEDPTAPLLNRVTQGQYQPGAALQTVVLAAALQDGTLPPFDATRAADSVDLSFNGETITLACGRTPSDALDGLFDAYAYACPLPFAEVGQALGAEELANAFAMFGFLDTPSPVRDPIAASLGQGELTVSPAQMVRVAAAVVNGGNLPQLYMVSHTRAPGGPWEAEPVPPVVEGAISRTAAQQIRDAMPRVYGTDIVGHAGLALSGPGDGALAWFIGAGDPDGDSSFAAAVVIEAATDTDDAVRIGALALRAARAAEN